MKALDADKSLQELLTAALEGALDERSAKQLNQRLKDDAQARALYLDMCSVHTMLMWKHENLASTTMVNPFTSQPIQANRVSDLQIDKKSGFQPIFQGRHVLSGIAALLVLMIGTIIFMRSFEEKKESEHAGTLAVTETEIDSSDRINVILYHEQAEWENSKLLAGPYELRSGLLSLNYKNGVHVVLEAPARFRVTTENHLHLALGRAAAQVPQKGIGFKISTPQMEVVDLGTEFGVDVSTEGQSEVHVFKGLVKVRSTLVDDEKPQQVKTAEAVRISHGERTLRHITYDEERFFCSLEEPVIGYSALVRSLKPIAYYRMGMSNDRIMRDVMRATPGQLLNGKGQRMPWSPGMVGSSLRTGGNSSSSGISFAQPPTNSTSSFAISLWAKADNYFSGAVLFCDQSAQGVLQISLDESGSYFRTTLSDKANQNITCQDKQKLVPGIWYHIAVVGDGQRLHFYINGELVAEQTYVPTNVWLSSVWYAGTNGNDQSVWNGCIDELVIFHHSLSLDDIRKLAQSRNKL